MPDTPAKRTSKPPRLMAALVIAMALTVAGSLWLVQQQARQLARPTLHSELWQAYQIHMEMDRLLLAAQALLAGKLASDDLVVRVQVLRSLTQPLEGQHLFDFLPESRPAAETTLERIIALSREWTGAPAGVIRKAPGRLPSAPCRHSRRYNGQCTK